MTRHTEVLAFSLLVYAGCVDDAIDEALDFGGLYESTDGTVVELGMDGSYLKGYVRTVGSSELKFPLQAGDEYFYTPFPPEQLPATFEAQTVGRVLQERAMITLSESSMMVQRSEFGAIPGQTSFARIDSGGGGGGGGGGGSTPLLYLMNLEGAEGTSTFYRVVVPSGTTRLVVESFEENEFGRNLGDLFVGRTQPRVTSRIPYNYSAECASINPNREREVCSFSNPAAGEWHILLYGYHEYYSTSLRVTIEP